MAKFPRNPHHKSALTFGELLENEGYYVEVVNFENGETSSRVRKVLEVGLSTSGPLYAAFHIVPGVRSKNKVFTISIG